MQSKPACRNRIRVHRHLTALALALPLAVGCSTVTHHHIAPHPAPEPPAAATDDAEDTPETDRRRVLLIVAEGLRQGVFAEYFETLEDADFDPDWPSGLATLRREGFGFAASERAEASVPGGGLAAAATWATGQWPEAHGIPGAVFHEARPDGYLVRYAFDTPVDGARVFYGPVLRWPDADAQALAGTLLRTETWAARLTPARRVAMVFAPFGQGAEWLVPEPIEIGAASRLPTDYAAAAMPLVDREVRDGAFEMLLDDEVDVVVAWFRGVGVSSCAQPPATCRSEADGIGGVQRDALRQLDERLGDLLRRYLIARPGGFDDLSVLLVGTGSGVDRGPGQSDKAVPVPALLERLAEDATDDACRARLTAAAAAGDLVVAAGGGALARITVRPAPPGQQHRMRRDLACLGGAIDALLEEAPWLAGAARLPPEGLGADGPRSSRFVVRLHPTFQRGLSARRRGRLVARIRRSIDDGATVRGGHALLFASAGWVFTDPLDGGRPPDVALGSIEAASMAIPFVIADRALSDVAEGAVRSTPVELADVAPTVLSMLGAPEAAAGLPRPPVVQWRLEPRRVLEHVRADRRIRPPPLGTLPVTSWSETGEALTLGLSESAELWPADVVAMRIGDAVFRWDPDANTFPEGLPCQYAEVDERRRWQCTVPVDRETPSVMTAAVRRAPSPEPNRDGPLDALIPVVIGDSRPTVTALTPRCVTDEAIDVRVEATDALGLGRLEVFLADGRIGQPGHVPGGLFAEAALGAVEPTEACASDPLGEGCALQATAPAVALEVSVPFSRRALDHFDVARRLPGIESADSAALAAAWAADEGSGPAPRSAYLVARTCNIAGRCVRRALMSDVAYASMRAAGCTPPTASR